MKQFFICCVFLSLLAGCKPKEELLNPDLTTDLTGTYGLTYYSQGTQQLVLPTGYASGQFDMSKIDITHLRVKLTMTFGGTSYPISTNDCELKRDATNLKLYRLILNGRNAGTITPAEVNVKDTSANGLITDIKAKR